MCDNTATLQNKNTSSATTQTPIKKPVGIFFIRVVICLIIIIGCLLLKFKQPEIFNSICIWYQNNVCCEKISHMYIKEELQTLIFKISFYLENLYQTYLKINF